MDKFLRGLITRGAFVCVCVCVCVRLCKFLVFFGGGIFSAAVAGAIRGVKTVL